MKRTCIADRILPPYTKGEEIFNMVSHIVGGALGVCYLVLCVTFSILNHSVIGVISSIVYGMSVITLFTMSSIYHGLPNSFAKRVLQVIDHCTIYFMIAGTYTPIVLCAVRRVSPITGWLVFSIVWGITAVAATFTAIDLNKYKRFSMICYIIMGWCIVAFWRITYQAIGVGGVIFLLVGGVLYTIGAILYGIGRKKRYVHSLFHIFVDLASLMHFFCIFFYVI